MFGVDSWALLTMTSTTKRTTAFDPNFFKLTPTIYGVTYHTTHAILGNPLMRWEGYFDQEI